MIKLSVFCCVDCAKFEAELASVTVERDSCRQELTAMQAESELVRRQKDETVLHLEQTIQQLNSDISELAKQVLQKVIHL